MAANKEYTFPDDRVYTETDEWVQLADDGTVRIGITDFAQSELSDIVFVELPDVGTDLAAGDSFGVVESVKAVSDLYAPIAGEVVEVNADLGDNPEWVNEDPNGRGWIVGLRPADADALSGLWSADEYRENVEERSAS